MTAAQGRTEVLRHTQGRTEVLRHTNVARQKGSLFERRAYVEKGAQCRVPGAAAAPANPWRPLFDGRGQLTVSCRPSSSRPWLSLPLSVIPPFILGLQARALSAFVIRGSPP